MRFHQVVSAGALALLVTSCSLEDTSDASTINVFLELDKTTLPLDETMSITVRAQNVGFDPITLTGPSDCLLYVEVLDQGSVVWHSGVSCSGNTVTQELAPGAFHAVTYTWNGTNLEGARLTSGVYPIRPIARVTGKPYVGPLVGVTLE